jgi:6,7-dimethyl-8-ribityllumazine synthase
MSSKDKNLSSTSTSPISGNGYVVGIVVAEWNADITHSMRDAAIACLEEHGVQSADIHVIEVPGAFELPFGAKLIIGKKKVDAVICIGCVIKGDTKHDEYINNAVASGIMTLGLASSKPVIFGVLTPNDMQQAIDRAGGIHGNKGVEAAMTALSMISLGKEAFVQKKGIGF